MKRNQLFLDGGLVDSGALRFLYGLMSLGACVA